MVGSGATPNESGSQRFLPHAQMHISLFMWLVMALLGPEL